MSIFDYLKPKAKKKDLVTDVPEDEYQLPTLSMGKFTMTDELIRRKQDELMKEKYGIHLKKEGEFI